MIKKSLLLALLLISISCNTTKNTIVTTKPVAEKAVARSVKNKNTNPIVDRASAKRKKQVNEIIESTSRTVVSNDIIYDYILQYKDIAMGNMKRFGIPASIILAQGILESGAGKGELARSANNHFGIKCHSDWSGESVRHDDDARQECFRKYSEPSESFKDHALFLTGRSRYSSLFNLSKEDYQAWAQGLRKAGYATDSNYPNKLISYIERYNLSQYDAQVLGKKYTVTIAQSQQVAANYNGLIHEVQKGDTLYSISRKYNLLVEELKRKNNLLDNTLSIGQQLIVD